MPAARPSVAVIRNAIKAAKLCGIHIGAIEVMPEDGVQVLAANAVGTLPSLHQRQ